MVFQLSEVVVHQRYLIDVLLSELGEDVADVQKWVGPGLLGEGLLILGELWLFGTVFGGAVAMGAELELFGLDGD